MQQTVFWLVFLIGTFVTMFVIVPPKIGPRLSYVGFWMGLVQAVILLWLGQSYFGFFRIIGDPTILGVPIIAALSWIPAAILFAYYFLFANSLYRKILLILIFASGASLAQYIFELLGMWESINWNLFASFILAVTTHLAITVFLIKGSVNVKC